ncbi:MAG: hypothetical protein D3X82_07900 [Candidatus Leucobacter sulfamidivorax]|nr:hypothetical protein [Candidatus Leucobacter sulfamidivorax]
MTDHLVRGKITMPALAESVIARPRVSSLVHARISGNRVVFVVASAGSGKTTAVAEALAGFDRPIAWLRLDDADQAPGRMLEYLAASLSSVIDMPEDWRPRGVEVTHRDLFALLAEAIGKQEVVVVIDELERLSATPAALAALDAFIQHSAAGIRFVLISRQDVGSVAHREALETGYVVERDLAFTVGEAASALARRSASAADAREAVLATGGWVTGVLFEAWRSSQHVHGTGGEVDPLHGYLASEIMARLPERIQSFLTLTSVLDSVTATAAERLGIRGAGEIISEIEGYGLPLNVAADHSLTCHPRFREFLRSQFSLLDHDLQASVRRAAAELLRSENRLEEAVGEYLAVGEVAEAEETASTVIAEVTGRLDFDLAAEWLSHFRRWRIESSAVLTSAELLVALEREEYGRGSRCADRLRAMDSESAELDPILYGYMAWCYFLVGRFDDAYHALDEAGPDPRLNAMRFVIGVELMDDGTTYRDRPDEVPEEFEGMLSRCDLVHGRFQRILSHRRPARSVVRLSQMSALTWLGRLEDAQLLSSGVTKNGWTAIRFRSELMAEAGEPEKAWAELISGRERLGQTESPLYRMFSLLAEATLTLRFTKDTAQASAALRAVEREPTALQRVRVVEQLDLWWGLIALLDGDVITAVGRLRAAVDLMSSVERWMFLPVAAVYLSEAEWRAGNESAADQAADLALSAAEATGSHHTLIQALTDFPSVLSRRLDLELDQDGVWQDLGRAMVLQTETQPGVLRRGEFHLVETGDAHLEFDDRSVELKLAKSAELLSFLALEGGSASRDQLIEALFESKTEKAAHAYLRMAVNEIRRALEDPDCIAVDANRVWWAAGSLRSDFTDLRVRLRRLANVGGQERLRLALSALHASEDKPYLAGGRSAWAQEQRERWSQLRLDTKHIAAEAAFEVADYRLAHKLVTEVLAADAFRERAWRLAMRISSAVGDQDRVIALYRKCEEALAEIPTTPAGATRRLLSELRA